MSSIDPALVRARAHAIWIAKGKREGRATEDWSQAERELAAEAAVKATAARPAPAPVAKAKVAPPPPPAPMKKKQKGKRR